MSGRDVNAPVLPVDQVRGCGVRPPTALRTSLEDVVPAFVAKGTGDVVPAARVKAVWGVMQLWSCPRGPWIGRGCSGLGRSGNEYQSQEDEGTELDGGTHCTGAPVCEHVSLDYPMAWRGL